MHEQPGVVTRGKVYLVGAGPGDPGLLTVRAAELIASADLIVYDSLTNPAVLEGCSAAAEARLLGGPGDPAQPTAEEIARQLVQMSGRFRRVVRLTGGDPFVFGRGGREALALADAGVEFELVPGVTAGTAAPAYAGIPLTHRGLSSSVAFVTGRDEALEDQEDGQWERLAMGADTMVIFMGARRLEAVVERLLKGGRSSTTPAAVVEWATYPRQRTIVSSLGELQAATDRAGIRAPSLIIVGEVVRLRERLAWFERRPLFGRRAVITRARAQASDLVRALQELGGEVVPFPTIQITDPSDPEPLRRAVREADCFDWIIFTSVNGVHRFWAELRAAGRDTRMLAGVSLCAIGPATAAALELEGAHADLVPPEFVAESVVEALSQEGGVEGTRILLPRAEVARPTIPDSLRQRGAEVTEVAAYRTVPDGEQVERVQTLLQRSEVDLITFTASSTVHNFVDLVGTEVGSATIACIGPITADTARSRGLPVHIQAETYTIPGLVAAIQSYFSAIPAAPREEI